MRPLPEKIHAQLLDKLQSSPSAKQLVARLPKLLLLPFAKLPASLRQAVIKKVLTQVLQSSLADGELNFLQDHFLRVVITDVYLTFYISVNDKALVIESERPEGYDVSFQGESHFMLLMMSREVDPDTLFFQRNLLMTGDTELGLEIKNFLDDFDMSALPATLQGALKQYGEVAVGNC